MSSLEEPTRPQKGQTEPVDKGREAIQAYVWLMRILAVFYLALALVFFFFPDQFAYFVDLTGRVLHLQGGLPGPIDQFWRILAATLMATLSAAALLAAESPRNHGYPILIITANLVSLVGFTALILDGQGAISYFVGALLDFLIAVVVAWNLFRTSRYGSDST